MVLSMKRWKGNVAVVIGAGGDIGTQIVKKLLDHGVIVVGMSPRKEVIQQISTSKALHCLKVDLRSEQQVLDALKWVKNTLGPVHVLINCASTFWCTDSIYGNTKHWRDTVDTDVFGLFVPTKEVVKEMITNNIDGHIVHISGLSRYGVYVPAAHAIATSKSTIRSMTESLRRELVDLHSKIKISNITPGAIKTGIFETNSSEEPELSDYVKKANFGRFLDCSDVADTVIYALSTPPHVQVHSIQMRSVGSH